MKPIVVSAVVDEQRRLVVDLPDEVPVGPVELIITPKPAANGEARAPEAGPTLTRDEVRARLAAAGMLVTTTFAPPDAKELSSEEEEALGLLYAGSHSIADEIIEDREDRV